MFRKSVLAKILAKKILQISRISQPTNYPIFSMISFSNYQLSFQIRTFVFKSQNQSFFSRSIWRKIFFLIVKNSWKFRKNFGKSLKNDSPKIPTNFPLAPNFRAKNPRWIYPGKNRDLRGNQGIAQPPRNPANRRPWARNGPKNRKNSDLAQHPA